MPIFFLAGLVKKSGRKDVAAVLAIPITLPEAAWVAKSIISIPAPTTGLRERIVVATGAI